MKNVKNTFSKPRGAGLGCTGRKMGCFKSFKNKNCNLSVNKCDFKQLLASQAQLRTAACAKSYPPF